MYTATEIVNNIRDNFTIVWRFMWLESKDMDSNLSPLKRWDFFFMMFVIGFRVVLFVGKNI